MKMSWFCSFYLMFLNILAVLVPTQIGAICNDYGTLGGLQVAANGAFSRTARKSASHPPRRAEHYIFTLSITWSPRERGEYLFTASNFVCLHYRVIFTAICFFPPLGMGACTVIRGSNQFANLELAPALLFMWNKLLSWATLVSGTHQ